MTSLLKSVTWTGLPTGGAFIVPKKRNSLPRGQDERLVVASR